ncbi:uncharacterized protein MONOS_12420 [Monocercomonoides exilis]|uniref:uncharacterized protein n=1 Tax=Monocercomonoides exilis TaxID=2049356 RepID=UPI00355ACC00|nr:hypothetical protein MONOS_12420 [Monocercomonoides exilis]|eukprot:MONOS_12420.1-p1 / transcript=MONOS_12420.1 / gene=MONOS_12420 / organism=Monocercomonoides_exilis_PA203 / gene_product=unspecified product / transcript_product=unspecified product / location=Mono_scaffold00687:6285-6776(+) / protein_length=164 / sequence_SO=supercontig / SO=protein_coding / is_pseudo=false
MLLKKKMMKKKMGQRIDNPGREGEEGALAVLVEQRRFDGSDVADAEENKIDIFQCSQHVRNTYRACHNSSQHVSTHLLLSGSQYVMDLFKRKQHEQEQTKKIPFVNIERSLYISCVELDVVTNLFHALNENSIVLNDRLAVDEKFDTTNDKLILGAYPPCKVL